MSISSWEDSGGDTSDEAGACSQPISPSLLFASSDGGFESGSIITVSVVLATASTICSSLVLEVSNASGVTVELSWTKVSGLLSENGFLCDCVVKIEVIEAPTMSAIGATSIFATGAALADIVVLVEVAREAEPEYVEFAESSINDSVLLTFRA